MALNKKEPQINYTNKIAAKIQQRRLQMLVHSYLYYDLNENIVSDAKWSEWAMELVKLQKDNPEIASQVIYAEEFEDFDGSSGFDLPYRINGIIDTGNRLLVYRDQHRKEQE